MHTEKYISNPVFFYFWGIKEGTKMLKWGSAFFLSVTK